MSDFDKKLHKLIEDHPSLFEKKPFLLKIVLPISLFTLFIFIGYYFSVVELAKVAPDFYEKSLKKSSISLYDEVYEEPEPEPEPEKMVEYEIEKEKKELWNKKPSKYQGKSGGGGDPRANLTKQGVLGIISGNVGSSANSYGVGSQASPTYSLDGDETGDQRANITKKGTLGIISGAIDGAVVVNSDPFGKGGYASGIDAVLAGSSGLKASGGGAGRAGAVGLGFGSGVGSGFGGASGVSGLDGLMASSSNSELKKRGNRKLKKASGASEGYIRSVDKESYYLSQNEPIKSVEYKQRSYQKEITVPKENPFKQVRYDNSSTFSIDVDDASYINIKRTVAHDMLPDPNIVRIEEMINHFSYNYPKPLGSNPFSVTTEVATCPWNPSNRVIQIGIRSRGLPKRTPPSNLVLLVDVSGSMEREDRLPLVQESLKLLVNNLTERDRISLITYAENAEVILSPTSGTEKQTIFSAIEQLYSEGATAGNDALTLAYKLARQNYLREGNNRIILATDGNFNIGASSTEELIKQISRRRGQGIFLTLLGFGIEPEAEPIMEQLANNGDGIFANITDVTEAKRVLVDQMKGNLFTVAKDVKIQTLFNSAAVDSFRLIGYENKVLKREDFSNDKVDAGEIGAEKMVTALYEVAPRVNYTTEQLCTLNIRYKESKDNSSKLLSQPIFDSGQGVYTASDNFRFATAVAELGMILRRSKYANLLSFDHARSLAQSALLGDVAGERYEFLQLVDRCKELEQFGAVTYVRSDDEFADYPMELSELGKQEVRKQRAELKRKRQKKAYIPSAKMTGGRSKASIMRVVRRNMSSLQYAYNARLKQKEGLKGKVTVKWAIDEFGTVIYCRVVSSTMNDPTFETQIVAKIKRWQFGKIPKPGDVTEVSYPFVFHQ